MAGKYRDPTFPPNELSLAFDPYAEDLNPDTKEFMSKVKSWRRPSEWARNPVLMKDDATPGDIEQGQLGDCWFLSALTVVSLKADLLEQLFVRCDDKRGQYTIRLYNMGRWEDVTIDDMIPCGADGKPVFGHCKDPEEIWVVLLEKAMAKLLGTYEGLDGGYLEEGVVYLTGGRPERITINNWKNKKGAIQEAEADLWDKLFTYCAEGHMMGAAISSGKETPDKTTGLVAGHAYGVLNVVETSDKLNKLIQLRNPWGCWEWKGKWCDGSKQWTQKYIQELKESFADDGAFWMELADFRKFFDKITVCRVFNDQILKFQSCLPVDLSHTVLANTTWHRTQFKGEWNELTAGGSVQDESYSQNPHFAVTVTEPTRFYFVLAQPPLTTQSDARYYRTGVGFNVIKGLLPKKGVAKLPPEQSGAKRNIGNASDGEVHVQTALRARYNSVELLLQPGQYTVIVYTDFPNRRTTYTFEAYAQNPFKVEPFKDDTDAVQEVPPSRAGKQASTVAAQVNTTLLPSKPIAPMAAAVALPSKAAKPQEPATRSTIGTSPIKVATVSPAKATNGSPGNAASRAAADLVRGSPTKEKSSPNLLQSKKIVSMDRWTSTNKFYFG